MSTRFRFALLLPCSIVLTGLGCSDSGSGPTIPATTLVLVSPVGGATNVAIDAPIVLTFSGPMGNGMDAYMDLHMGTTAAAIVPMTCSWSMDGMSVTCTHAALAHGGSYTLHVGGGMRDAIGAPITMDNMMGQMGGQWLTSGMMGGMHAGQPMNMMGAGWMGTNGNYGMIFPFTTS